MIRTRSGKALKSQVDTFLLNLGAAQALSYIVHIDPIFAKFISEECGVDLTGIEQLSRAASLVGSRIKNVNDIVTEENCENWLKASEGG